MSKSNKLFLIAAILITFCALVVLAVKKGPALMWPLVERWLFSASADLKPSAEAALLLADLTAFRVNSAALPPPQAAIEWVGLWDRARALLTSPNAGDTQVFDAAVGERIGMRSVIAALPPPPAWDAIGAIALKRKDARPDDKNSLGLFLVTQILTGDRANIAAATTHFETRAALKSVASAAWRKTTLAQTRAAVARLYGTPAEIVESAIALADLGAPIDSERTAEIPDLVGLVGEAKASALLTTLLKQPLKLTVREGDATRTLAQKIALAQIDTLAAPQWGLLQNMGTAKLYEAMQAKFDSVKPATTVTEKVFNHFSGNYDYVRHEADQYYFLDLVVAGRHADAERAMERLIKASASFDVPRKAMAALVKNGQNEAVYRFLAQLLERRPELPAWDAYLQQAAFLNRAPAAITLLDKMLGRGKLPASTLALLAAKRVDALLGADRVDEALRDLAGVIEKGTGSASKDAAAAIRMAALGRVLKQPAIAKSAIERALQLMAKSPDSTDYQRDSQLRDLLAELRLQGLVVDAKKLALAELAREPASWLSTAMFNPMAEESIRRVAVIELAGIADASGDHAELVRLLDEAVGWGATDVAQIAGSKDSQGMTLGAMVARALKARGNTAQAKRATLDLLDAAPGNDQGYQLALDLYGDETPALLDARYALDQFEERPLIWKASSLLKAGKQADAEATIRRAIAIDPSDGEQGANDRMRGYAVLADILAAKGDATGSNELRRAVAAIRKSESADELHKLGLYQRAFAGYRAAIAEFSDAYCIQSRLAVQLAKQGQHGEALKHYTRAFELMPDSFGRIESHCFGCENVFADSQAQGVAERIFTDIIARAPTKPQAHYMLGYLRKEQGRAAEAVPLFRHAAQLDVTYLNAWKHLHDLGGKTYIEAAERDVARFRLIELDPFRRHVSYELTEVTNLAALWNKAVRANASAKASAGSEPSYPLKASAAESAKRFAAMPSALQSQYLSMAKIFGREKTKGQELKIGTVLSDHVLMGFALQLMEEAVVEEPDDNKPAAEVK